VAILMPVNWALETLKWYLLVNKFQSLTFIKAFEGVLSGLSLAMNTPNRIGEYGGRVLYLNPSFRLKGIALTVLSSVSQLFITLLMGCIALFVLHPVLQNMNVEGTAVNGIVYTAFKYSVLLVTVITGVFYFRMQWLAKMAHWIPAIRKRFSFALVVEQLRGRLMVEILFYSFLRFIVFALQYILLWQALDVNIGWWQGFWSIALIFLIMAVVPSIAIAELGIRGKVAVSILGLFSTNSVAILTGTVAMWLLNLVLPALAGSLFLLTVKIFKEK
jgi:hypothetical protein